MPRRLKGREERAIETYHNDTLLSCGAENDLRKDNIERLRDLYPQLGGTADTCKTSLGGATNTGWKPMLCYATLFSGLLSDLSKQSLTCRREPAVTTRRRKVT
jgi:hypothetical protein